MNCEAVSQSQRQHKIQSQTPATHYKFSSTNARGCNGSQIVSATLPICTYNLDLTFAKKTTFTKRKGQRVLPNSPTLSTTPSLPRHCRKNKINSKCRCYLYSFWCAYETKLIDKEFKSIFAEEFRGIVSLQKVTFSVSVPNVKL